MNFGFLLIPLYGAYLETPSITRVYAVCGFKELRVVKHEMACLKVRNKYQISLMISYSVGCANG
jgi:hypothetical protein